jgi:hypothetical protein
MLDVRWYHGGKQERLGSITQPLRLSLPDNDTLFIPLEATRAPAHWPLRIRDEGAGHKSVLGPLREGGKETLDRGVQCMCEPAKRYVALSPFFPLFFILIPPRSARRIDLAP